MLVRKVVGPYYPYKDLMQVKLWDARTVRDMMHYIGERHVSLCEMHKLGLWKGFEGVFQEQARHEGYVALIASKERVAGMDAEMVVWMAADHLEAWYYWQFGARYGKRVDSDKYSTGSSEF